MSHGDLFRNNNRNLESFLADLVKELEVPEGRYRDAERSYHSVGEWLGRDESKVQQYSPNVYIQGSFRLGTAIRPINENEDYDVDLVCELTLDIEETTQADLKELFKAEMAAYAEAHGMEPPSEGRRCVTLNYADGAQFHLDVLPAVPDGGRKVMALAMESLSTDWAETAIAITDHEHPRFRIRTNRWPHSNPKGFSSWFQDRMRQVFDAKRYALALEAKASVEDIPEHEVKTPLQAAVQIMKRHRDMMFKDRPEEKPISVIISTLAAKAYGSDATISGALGTILSTMRSSIETRDGVVWIPNPTDPKENFADRWQEHPERRDAFFEWLEQARADFAEAASQTSRQLLVEATASWVGAAARRAGTQVTTPNRQGLSARIGQALNWAHRKAAPWQVYKAGNVAISLVAQRDGFRPDAVHSDGAALPKGTALRFVAKTDVVGPYDVYWQITNTGPEAQQANALRGDFSKGAVVRDEIVHTETAAYHGPHSIECFIVKAGLLVASSGQFIVNVE